MCLSSHVVRTAVVACVLLTIVAKQCAAIEAQALEEPFASILKDIVSEDAKARMSAFEQFRNLGMEGVKQLLRLMPQLGEGKDGGVRYAIHGLAATLTAKGMEKERKELSMTLCELLASDLPKWVKRFIIEQLQIVGGEEAVEALSKQLGDEELSESARQALQANPSEAALRALRGWLPKATGNLRIGIINTLGERRDSKALELIMNEAKSNDADVRGAAYEALGKLGDTAALDALLNGLRDENVRARRCAFAGVLMLGERLIAVGRKDEALKVYCETLKLVDGSQDRRTLLTHIIPIANLNAIEAIATCLNDKSAHVRALAFNCLNEIKGEAASKVLAKLIAKADERVRTLIVLVLGGREDAAAVAAINAAAKDKSDAVKVAALYALGKLEDEALEGTLLNAATSNIDEVHEIALRAYLGFANAKLNRGDVGYAAKMFANALRLARTPELIRRALEGAVSAPSEDALKVVEELFGEPAVSVDAARSYAAIAGKLTEAGQRDRAEEMLLKLAAMSLPRDVANAVAAQLRKLRPEIDLAVARGFITSWWVIGPFSGTDIDAALPPEKEINLDVPVKIDGAELKWFKHQTGDIDGIVDLGALLKPNTNVTAYMYAEIEVERECDALLKMGSDDSMKCWLNGKLVHRYQNPRSLTIDQDVVKVRLQTGVNKLLLKVINFGGGWCATLRITDVDERPLKFKQR